MKGIALFGGIALLVLAAMAGLVFLVIILARMMGGIFRRASGWEVLARQFPGPEQAPAETRTGAVKVGSVYLRYGPRFAPTPQGLYLVYKSVYSYPSLLIPWNALYNPKKTLLFWRAARSYEIGSPAVTTLTLWEEVWKGLKPDLPAAG